MKIVMNKCQFFQMLFLTRAHYFAEQQLLCYVPLQLVPRSTFTCLTQNFNGETLQLWVLAGLLSPPLTCNKERFKKSMTRPFASPVQQHNNINKSRSSHTWNDSSDLISLTGLIKATFTEPIHLKLSANFSYNATFLYQITQS